MRNLPKEVFVIILHYTTGILATGYSCDKYYVSQPDGGVIASNNYPFDYHDNEVCIYRIYTGDLYPGEDVQVCFKVHRFKTDCLVGFCRDSLGLDGEKYCGPGVATNGKSVWRENFRTGTFKDVFEFSFKSDHRNMHPGFYATYELLSLKNITFLDDDSGENLENNELCPFGFWRCFNRRCINSTEKCDGVDSCGDNSDETYEHARCNFLETGDLETIACDFTYDNCAYSYADTSRWKVVSKSEHHQLGYGPNYDHTYLDSVGPSKFLISNFAQARFNLDAILDADTEYCLSFWYHLSGFDAGKLQLHYTRSTESGAADWSRNGNYSDKWQIGEVRLKTTHAGKRSFNFLAERGSIRVSHAALDDISLQKGACLGMADVSCNFEKETTCGWTLGTEWRTLPNIYPSSNGLSVAYLTGINGSMTSPYISKSRNQHFCLVFWMLMDCRRGSCRLKIYLNRINTQINTDVFDEEVNGQVLSWDQHKVDIQHGVDEPFQIVMEGTRHPDAFLAVDTIELVQTACVNLDLQSCETLQFRCRSDGTCIPGTFMCDGQLDCPDGSDESHEAGCKETCQPDQFTCNNGDCIDIDDYCDGINNCTDNSDEHGCGGVSQNSVSLSIGAVTGITMAVIMVLCIVGFKIGWCILKGDFQQIGRLWCCCRDETEEPIDGETYAPPPSYSECVNNNNKQRRPPPNISVLSNAERSEDQIDLPPSYETVRIEGYLEITHPVKSEIDKLKRFSQALNNGTHAEASAIDCEDTEFCMEIDDANVSSSTANPGPSYQNYAFVDETINKEISNPITIPWKLTRTHDPSLCGDDQCSRNLELHYICDGQQFS